MKYLETSFLKFENAYDFLYGGLWCIIITYILWSIRKWQSSKKPGLPLPGLKTPTLSLLGSLYTFPSRRIMKQCSLPISAFVVQTFSAHSKIFEKEKIFFFDLGPSRMVVLRTPESVEEIMKSTSLTTKSWDYQFLWPWLGKGLLTSSGPKWKSRRKLLTPSFHFDILKDFLAVMNDQSKILVHVLKKSVNKEYIDIVQPVTMCTLDIICASTLGVEIGAQMDSESEYVRAVLRTSQIVMDRMFMPTLWPDVLFHMSSRGRQFLKDVKTLHSFTMKVIRQKQAAFKQRSKEEQESKVPVSEGRKRRKALMDLLIEHQMQHHDLTEEDIREEVDTFVFEGHDTTSMGLSWAMYLIGLYPDVQEKLHEEMDRIFGDDTDRDVTEDDIRDFRYLENVLKESQRLYPSVPIIARAVEEDQVYMGYRVTKGSTFVIGTYFLHHNPNTFPDPERFDPDRFLPENSIGRHPYAYIPFSAGARNCIGQRFALMEEKVVMANILRNFNIKSLDQRDKVIVATDLILRSNGPLRLKFTPRKAFDSGA